MALKPLQLCHAKQLIQFLEGDKQIRAINNLTGRQHLPERAYSVVHALDRGGGKQSWIDYDGDTKLLQMGGREERRGCALADAETHVDGERLGHGAGNSLNVVYGKECIRK